MTDTLDIVPISDHYYLRGSFGLERVWRITHTYRLLSLTCRVRIGIRRKRQWLRYNFDSQRHTVHQANWNPLQEQCRARLGEVSIARLLRKEAHQFA